MSRVILLLSLLMVTLNANTTALLPIDANDEATVRELKDRYPDSDMAYEFIQENITFEWNKKSEADWPIDAKVSAEGHAICLSTGCRYQYPIFYDNFSSVDKVKVVQDNGKTTSRYQIADRQLESSGIFHNDVRYKLVNRVVGEFGTRTGFAYEKTYNDIRYLTSLYLLEPYPVEDRKVSITVPDWLDLEIREFHFDDIKYKRWEEDDKDGKVIHYQFTELPEKPREPMSPGPSYFEPHFVFVFHEATDPKEGTKVQMFSSAADLYEWYQELVSGVSNNIEPLKPIINKLISDANTDEQNMAALYYWVQDNIRYIAFEDGIAGFKPEEASKVYDNRYGDCKGMANLLSAMLRAAGYDARLAWLGTKRVFYDYSLPSLCVDNHVICAVMHNGETIYLDPTEEFAPFGTLAHRIQGRNVLIEDGKSFILDSIPDLQWNENLEEQHYRCTLTPDNTLSGNVDYTFHGESKARLLRNYNSTGLEDRTDALVNFLSSGNKNISVSDVQHSPFSERDSILNIQFNLELANHIIPLNDELYVDLDYEKTFQTFTIDDERETPVAFSRKYDVIYTSTLKLPENTVVEHLPEALSIDHTAFAFDCQYKKSGSSISYERQIVLKSGYIFPEHFGDWNDAIDQLDTFYKDMILLKLN